MQALGGRKPKEGKGVAPSKRPTPLWCPRGITKTQKCRLQKMRQRELAEKKEEEKAPMMPPGGGMDGMGGMY